MSILTDAKTYYKYLESITSKNNAASQKTADKMMAFQREMSDTAHQREVADLKAAGLNPVLSAGGQGASSPQGAMAQTDMSAASALTGYLQSLINQQTSLGAAMIQANAARDVANINAASPNSWAGLAREVLQQMGFIPTSNSESLEQRTDRIENVMKFVENTIPGASTIKDIYDTVLEWKNSDVGLWNSFKAYVRSGSEYLYNQFMAAVIRNIHATTPSFNTGPSGHSSNPR